MEDFADVWRGLHGPLRRYLRGRGAGVDDVDDLVQETALRLFVAWSRLDRTAPLGPLARTIALNLWRDHCRSRAGRALCVAELPEMADRAPGVERVVLAREELAGTLRDISRLTVDERAVVQAGAARCLGLLARPSSAAERMRLMRCRRSLRSARDVPRAPRPPSERAPAHEQGLPTAETAVGGPASIPATRPAAPRHAGLPLSRPFRPATGVVLGGWLPHAAMCRPPVSLARVSHAFKGPGGG
jgi:hypothetical protein